MEVSYLVLIGGGILSSLVGLIGIALTKHDNTPILGLISPDELKSYRTKRLMTEGISWCTMGRHEFRPGPGASIHNCPECLPPIIVDSVISRAIGQAKEGQAQPWNQRTYAAHGRRAYTPLHLAGWADIFSKDEEDQ